ncbi:MAG: sialidase family protein, partial [Planctomycetaceae bacterium]
DQHSKRICLPFTRDNDRVYVTSSADHGMSWEQPREITRSVKADDWTWYATGPGVGIQLRQKRFAGRLVIPCDHRVRGAGSRADATRSHVIYSDDHGQTWQAGQATDWRMNECAVVELPDGQLLLNMRSNRGKQRRAVAWSRDGGQSWSPAVEADALIEPVCQASLIACTHQRSPGVLLFCNPASTRQRARLTVRLSRDAGSTWSSGRVIDRGPAAYSSLAELPDQSIGVLYERGGYSAVTFVRVPFDGLESDSTSR